MKMLKHKSNSTINTILETIIPFDKLTNYATIDPMSRGILQTKPQIKEFKIVYVVIL